MSFQAQTIDMTMLDSDIGLEQASPISDHLPLGLAHGHILFDEAIDSVRNLLTEEHQRLFHHRVGASSLLDELRTVGTSTNRENSVLVTCSQKFALFVRVFAPYFDVLMVCTTVRTEWLDCLWGLVRLVFQVASNHVLFLEKVADMFEAIASLLPPYHQISEICKSRAGRSQVSVEDERLTALMSYVYADVTALCLELYCVFIRGYNGTVLRHLTFGTSSTSQWRPLDSRFAHLEARLTHHRRWLEKETESQVQDFEEIELHRTKYINFLHRQANVNTNRGEELEDQRIAKRVKRVDKITSWISRSPPNKNDGQISIHQNYVESCEWFFQLAKYRRWKDQAFTQGQATTATLQSSWHDRVLFVQAKSGFGKTYLARAVVEDLITETEDFSNTDELPSTVSFHIKATGADFVQPDDVFRALLSQLLHCHRHNRATLDAVCLLLRKTSFQDMATTSEVIDVLSVLLRQHPTFLVIDGLDECNDVKGFLSSLAKLCRISDARAIIFSTPNIEIPLEYQKWASDAPHILSLNESHNSLAIERYVREHLDHTAAKGYFGASIDHMLVSRIAQQSNGTFLWASILLRYLESPILTADDRRSVLENIQSLQNLDGLYRAMLVTLGSRPLPEKRIIGDVFRWLSFPIHRLCCSSLRTALASSLTVAESEDVFPTTDIIDVLPQLTCGLVGIEQDSVYFIHQSLRDFLHNPLSHNSEFSVHDESNVHAHLAARCLSYLAHNVPRRPLGGLSPRIRPMPGTLPSSGASQRTNKSGDSGYKSLSSSDTDHPLPQPSIPTHHNNPSQASIRTIPFDTNLPFLRYASLCWPIHLSRALSATQLHHGNLGLPHSLYTTIPYLFSLSAFLSSRLAVTAWVEASFRYSLPPTLTRLVGPLSDLKGEVSPATVEGKELRVALHDISELSQRLVELKREYATSLRENPSLIWQMVDTSGEDYWPVWDGGMGMPR